ncbi:GntR family transcriptional regulator [Nocardioides sp. MAHUQ-72]|uniref:GntR family transcriptional regulator n=1 Tax=unclassified Nocardioides TaxID=2615069 RepID=UPI00360C73CC
MTSNPVDGGAPGLVHLSLPDSVHQTLRRRILNNELGAGTRLVEANLAEELGVSRGTVRVALRQLATEGLVDIAPRRHSVVTRMSYADIDDACYARYVLEEGAMRAIPTEQLTALADELCRVTESMEEAAASGDMVAIVDLDTHFHGCIVQASHKQRLAGLWSTLDGQMGAVMRSSMEDQHIGLPEAAGRHRQLAEVIRSGDRAAIAEALYGHYLRTPAP